MLALPTIYVKSPATARYPGAVDPQNAPERLRELPSWLVNQASLHAQRVVNEHLRDAQVAHRYHYSLLAALAESGPTSQADLGRRIGLDRSDVTASVNLMEHGGMLARVPDPADRRRNLVSLTEAGRRHLAELDKAVETAQDDLLAPLTEEERSELVRLLRLLADHHGAGS
jgi:DNA-binding MarR family transcriptional regulator